MKNYLYSAFVGFTLCSGAPLVSLAGENQMSKATCIVEEVTQLEKEAIDLLGFALARFECIEAIGADKDEAHSVTARVSEHDLPAISHLVKSKQPALFEFQDTYFGTLISYGGTQANNSPLPAVRTGLENNGRYTTVTFKDVLGSIDPKIYKVVQEIGPQILQQNKMSLNLSVGDDGLGQLKLVVLTKDIENITIPTRGGEIKMPNGKFMAVDQMDIAGESAEAIRVMLLKAKMPQYHFENGVDFQGIAQDFVSLGKDKDNSLFHCWLRESPKNKTGCSLSGMRLK